ncbi:bolA-like protein DDB_G0274169 isoform X1 [Cotesia typhae]
MLRKVNFQNKILGSIHQNIKNNMSTSNRPVENSMKKKLEKDLEPSHLEIINESAMHNVPKDSESHFKVVVVSDKFKDVPLIKRHRMVNDLLKTELEESIHALSIVAKTPSQWEESNKVIAPSPACKGGFGK